MSEWLSTNSDVVCPSHPEQSLALIGFEDRAGTHVVLLRCSRDEDGDELVHDMGLTFEPNADPADGDVGTLRCRVEARGEEWQEQGKPGPADEASGG